MAALGLIPDANRQRSRGAKYRTMTENQARFLECYATSGSVGLASRWAHVHRSSHHSWMKSDPTYPARFKDAQARAAQTFEDEAVRRAVHGVKRPMFYQGKPIKVNGEIAFETVYSDRLLERLLEANNPDKFKRRNETTFQWSGDPAELSQEQLSVLEEKLLERAFGGDQEKMAEHRRLLEAGPVIETTAVVINAESAPVETRST